MTKIEWCARPDTTPKSWNPIRARNRETGGVGHFCVHVSDGCKNCYAERMQPRFQNRIRYAAQDQAKVDVFLDEKALTAPLRWKKPATIFVCSMTDLYGEWVPDEWTDRIKAVEALCPQHVFIEVTKRPERMREYLADARTRDRVAVVFARLFAGVRSHPRNPVIWNKTMQWPSPNVWALTSIEDQPTADKRLPHILATQAAVRGVSIEPLLGPVDLREVSTAGIGSAAGNKLNDVLHWVIVGGESGPGARPMHPDWARSIRDQCKAAGVAYFFKQWGAWGPIPDYQVQDADCDCAISIDGTISSYASIHDQTARTMRRFGKKAAGRLLDGVEHSEYPEART